MAFESRILKDGRPEIYWSRNGLCVVIVDGPELVKNVCKVDFNQNTASSFVRLFSRPISVHLAKICMITV